MKLSSALPVLPFRFFGGSLDWLVARSPKHPLRCKDGEGAAAHALGESLQILLQIIWSIEHTKITRKKIRIGR